MATYTKYYQFIEDLHNQVHKLIGTGGSGGVHVCKVMLSNAAPNQSTHAVRGDATEISGGNGYTSGGFSVTNIGSRTGGTLVLTGSDVTITASGGTIGPFRYAIVYNDTPTSPADPLIAYWDRGASITLQDGDSVLIDLGSNIYSQS